MVKLSDLKIVVRGAGEMASAIACALVRSHFTKLCLTDIHEPTAIRRKVCFSEAVYDGGAEVEEVKAQLVHCVTEIKVLWEDGLIPVIVDPDAKIKGELQPDVLVDCILAKQNLGTRLSDASLVIGLGPGFIAGHDVHAVIETNRGHRLGQIIRTGGAEKDTGVPAPVLTSDVDRVLRSLGEGVFSNRRQIGDAVQKGEIIGVVDGTPIEAKIEGVLRGLIRPDIRVTTGMKIGDIDPRGQKQYCYTISDKARCVAGSVLEVILTQFNR